MDMMTFDALPYLMLRRVADFLRGRDMVEVSCVDVKRAVLSFSLWERDVAQGEGQASEGGSDCLRAPIYRFLSAGDREKQRLGASRERRPGLKTVLASYPRSGNSLLRRLLEEVTGVITGADTRPDRTLSRSLSVLGMQGEGVTDNRVEIVKTHYPERMGYRPFDSDKAILLVRNPFDAINSYFNMTLTNTHDQSLHDCVYEEFHQKWDGMIRNETKVSPFPGTYQVWERFQLFWLSRSIPVYVLRYEDLLEKPEASLRDLIGFIYELPSGEVEKIYEDRLRRAPGLIMPGRNSCNFRGREGRHEADTGKVENPTQTKSDVTHDFTGSGANGFPESAQQGGAGPYRRRSSGGVGSSIGKRYSQSQVDWCAKEAEGLLRRFGYDPVSQGFPPAASDDLLELWRPRVGNAANGHISDTADSAGLVRPEAESVVTVNDKTVSLGIRADDDGYGRAMTTFRRSHTQRDRQPLPLRGEDSKAHEWLRRRRQQAVIDKAGHA